MEKKQHQAKLNRREMKLKALKHKGGHCEICGYSKCIAALTFHHINPEEKSFGISDKGHKFGWERVKEELKKCILLCSNCHIEVHEGVADPNIKKTVENAA